MPSTMPEELLWPVRMRCKKCRKYFGFIVVDQLFCSYECAGYAQPEQDINEAPRECKHHRLGRWAWKRRFFSEAEARSRRGMRYSQNVYKCGNCHMWHIGTLHRKVEA